MKIISFWLVEWGLFTIFLPWLLPARIGQQKDWGKSVTADFHRWWTVLRLPWVKTTPLPLESMLLEVAGRLEAGASPAQAWQITLERQNLQVVSWPAGTVPDALLWQTLKDQIRESDQLALVSVVTAIRFSQAVGSPLAQVLRHCAGAIAQAAQAADQRRLALTAPKTSAQLLSFLPLGGIILGTILGLHPLTTLFDGGLGTVSGLAGVLLMLAGYWWMQKLVERAAQ